MTGRNIYGTNLLLREVGADTFYYMYNGHADVTALLTPDGIVAASYTYDAFGNILEQTGDVRNAILFAGYQFDKETGLYYLNARMYDPVTARFMQEDTFAGQREDPLSLNLYTYCHNSPLLYSDPTGHSAEEIEAITTKIKDLNNSGTHNPGLFAQINALEAEKERLIQKEEDARKKEEDARKKEGQKLTAKYNTINSFIKDHPEFAEQDHVQAVMDCANHIGTNTYLSVMEGYIASYKEYKAGDSFKEWVQKQSKPVRGEWFDHIPMDAQNAVREGEEKLQWVSYDKQVLEYFGIDDTNNYKDQSVNIDLFLAVIAQTDTMSPELEEFYKKLPMFFDARYAAGSTTSVSDCGGLSRGIYKKLGYVILEDGETGPDIWTNPDTNKTNSSRVHYAWTASDSQNVVYDRRKDPYKPIDLNMLEPGDVIYYDLKGNNDGADHVSIYVGSVIETVGSISKTQHVIIETNGTSDPVGFRIIENETHRSRYDPRDPQANNYGILGVKRYLDDV